MCIIVYKPANVDMPTWETLQRCFDANKDGAGFMFRHDGRVEIRKGFLTFDALKVALECEPFLTDVKAAEIGIHFRWATHGNVDAANCHPFPVTTNVGMLRGTCVRAKAALMHNGVIPEFSLVKSDASDTRLFVKVLADMRNIDANAAFLLTGRGKFLLMTRASTIRVGQFVEDGGVFYSNDGYKEVEYVYPGAGITAASPTRVCEDSVLYSKKERKRFTRARDQNPACNRCPSWECWTIEDCIDSACQTIDAIIDDDAFTSGRGKKYDDALDPCYGCPQYPHGSECEVWAECEGRYSTATDPSTWFNAGREYDDERAEELAQCMVEARARAAAADAEAKRNGAILLGKIKTSLPYYTL